MYSFSNPNILATTPLDSAVATSRLLVDFEPVATHSVVPDDSRMMAQGHTFSSKARSTGTDLHVSDLRQLNDQIPGTRTGIKSPEPPLSLSSSRDEQHQDATAQVFR
jgi:hypothetical protein